MPHFEHSSKSNLPKVLAAVGTVQEHKRFHATSEQAKRNAINNFEKLDVILTKMEKLVLLGSLNERQSTSVLEMYFTQRIIDEISSYLNNDFKELTYISIVETAQCLSTWRFSNTLCLRIENCRVRHYWSSPHECLDTSNYVVDFFLQKNGMII